MSREECRETGPRWTERDFEEWLVRKGELPDGEPLVLLSRQRALKRVVDLLFLDNTGGLVLVEVKNETSSRTVIGQALEYLSQYENVDLDALLDDLRTEGGAGAKIAENVTRAAVSTITRRRRIFLAAPAFDFATQASVVLLNDRFASADLSLGLICVGKTKGGFVTRFLDPVKPVAIQQLRGKCGLNARGRLFFVLPEGPGNLVVNLGRIKDGELSAPKGVTATQRLVRRRTGSLIPYSGPSIPAPGELGKVWRHRTRRRNAIVLARVAEPQASGGARVYFAVEEAGAIIGYRIRSAANFADWYPQATRADLDWRLLLREAFEQGKA